MGGTHGERVVAHAGVESPQASLQLHTRGAHTQPGVERGARRPERCVRVRHRRVAHTHTHAAHTHAWHHDLHATALQTKHRMHRML